MVVRHPSLFQTDLQKGMLCLWQLCNSMSKSCILYFFMNRFFDVLQNFNHKTWTECCLLIWLFIKVSVCHPHFALLSAAGKTQGNKGANDGPPAWRGLCVDELLYTKQLNGERREGPAGRKPGGGGGIGWVSWNMWLHVTYLPQRWTVVRSALGL